MASDATDSSTLVVGNSVIVQVDRPAIHKASKALLKHLQEAKWEEEAHQKSKSLLGSDAALGDEAIWLIVSTKKHLVTNKRLKSTKVLIPHSLNSSPTLSICLIVPDPQRAFKDVLTRLASTPQYPYHIDRIIDIKKLEKKYHSYESKRQLRSSYDLFLADDRIITYLPKIMGKTFFSSTLKRPIPVHLQPRKVKGEKKNSFSPVVNTKKDPKPTSIAEPSEFAQEIDRTLLTTTVNPGPSATTAVRVGLASFSPDQLTDNVEAVIEAVVNKLIPKKWEGLKAVHIKGPNSMALPIWLAEEMWEDEADVLEESEIKQQGSGTLSKKKRLQTLEEQQKYSVNALEGILSITYDRSVDSSKRRRVDNEDLAQQTKKQRKQLRQHKEELRGKLMDQESRSQVLAVS